MVTLSWRIGDVGGYGKGKGRAESGLAGKTGGNR